MPHFMVQIAYTSDACAKLADNPQNRALALAPVIERLGGRLENWWFALGEYDVVAIAELPDNESAAALAIAVSAGGAVRSHRTTPLLTAEEGVAAMNHATRIGYDAPW